MNVLALLQQLQNGQPQQNDQGNDADFVMPVADSDQRRDKFGQPYKITPFQGNPPQQPGRFAGQRGSPDLPDNTDVRIMQKVPTDSVQEDFADKFGTEALDRTNRNRQGIRNPGYVPTPRPNPMREDEELLKLLESEIDSTRR